MRKIWQLTYLLCEKLLKPLVFCGYLVKVAFFVRQISNPRIAFILGRREYKMLILGRKIIFPKSNDVVFFIHIF
jgi:hypothetical protein